MVPDVLVAIRPGRGARSQGGVPGGIDQPITQARSTSRCIRKSLIAQSDSTRIRPPIGDIAGHWPVHPRIGFRVIDIQLSIPVVALPAMTADINRSAIG
jgi:hypothetical protein